MRWRTLGLGLTLTLTSIMGWAQSAPPSPPAPPSVSHAVPEDARAPLFTLFQEELDRLQKGIPFAKLVLLDTSQPAYRAYAAMGLFKQDETSFTRLESGLSGAAVSDGAIDGQHGPVCYVLYDPEQAGSVYRQFVLPITHVTDERSAAAFLMGHEVGHCLDYLERRDALKKKMVWNTQDLAPIGLIPVAIQRVFGSTLSSAAYLAHGADLYRDNAQRQYEERLADIFGMAWVWRLGGQQAVLDAVVASRSHANPWDAHATVPALLALGQDKEALALTSSVADVWALARKIQLQVGVDPSLGVDSKHALNPMSEYLDHPTEPPAEMKPRPLPQPVGHNFNDLPRFGAPTEQPGQS